MKGKNIAVTGSSGFVGTQLVKELTKKNFNVIGIDLKEKIDITDRKSLEKIPKFDVIVHLAGKSFIPHSYLNPQEFYYTNIVGTLNCLELCRKYDSRMVLASSYVYGRPQYLPIDENHPVHAHNPYSQSKIICEQLCEGYHRDFGIPIIIIRPFNIYGINQPGDYLIASIIKQIKNRNVVVKDIRPRRDFVYLDDVVDAYICAVSYDKNDFDVFNISSGKSFSVEETISKIKTISSSEFEVVNLGEILDVYGDNSKARKLLNWFPKIDFEEGLRKVILKEFHLS
jgi:nucleoside-diphosphate-sugar epimerase